MKKETKKTEMTLYIMKFTLTALTKAMDEDA